MQEIFNFAVLVSTSVPSLKLNLKLYKEGKINRLPDPDYFEPSVMYEITDDSLKKLQEENIENVHLEKLSEIKGKSYNNKEFKITVIKIIGEDLYKKHRNTLKKQSLQYVSNIEDCATDYKKRLATYLYFSAFSYFEFYIGEICDEIINSQPKIDIDSYLSNHLATHENTQKRIKLDHNLDSRRIDRYKSISKQLINEGYKKPNEILFNSLISLLKSQSEDLKANNIPDFLEKVFLYKFSKSDSDTFHSIRSNRNSIGHGDHSYAPDLSDVVEMNRFLKKLSSDIDSHIIFHFKELNNFSA